MNATFLKLMLCNAVIFISPYALAAALSQPQRISGCEASKMQLEPDDFKLITRKDASKICKEVEASLLKLPSKTFFRGICTLVALMKVRDTKESYENIAYQIMNVIEIREQNDEEAMLETLDTLWTIFNGSNGRVTPKDMNIALRKLKYPAKKMSRRDMFKLGAMIHENKKNEQ